jgi:serine/threonine protein kinase
MPSANQELFLNLVEQQPNIDGRFANPKRLGPHGGGGNFSILFRATDLTTRQDVALKFYNPDKMSDSYRWQSFIREEEILHQLAGQPDIIGWVGPRSEFTVPVLLPLGSTYNFQFNYFSVELASHSVGAVIAQDWWNIEQRLVSFRAICRAVQRIHRVSIAHRDLKPENFLVMLDGTVVLSDFGAARDLSSTTPALIGKYSGPPGDLSYSAPEMLACLHDSQPQIAIRADIYALGAILFEFFSGTQLVHQLFSLNDIGNLIQSMSVVKREKRVDIYHQFIRDVSIAHPLPSLRLLGAPVPACICSQIDILYRSMAALDYRNRSADFQSIFRQIDICLIILRNDAEYRRRIGMKRQRRAGRHIALVTKEGSL